MIIRTIAPRAIALALAAVSLAPAAAWAADREHQQMMADLRILQEQTQQLQALLGELGEALKAVNSRLDDQSSLERKAFADGKVQMDAISGDLRVVREKVDETNVRLGTLSQELESLRQAIPEPGAMPQMPPAPLTSDAGGAGAVGSAAPPQTAPPPAQTVGPVPPVAAGIQPQKLWQQAYADYTSGNYTLAVQGFASFLSYFPKSPQAHEAQFLIGESFAWDKKDMEAVAAYNRVIANYPGTASVPNAYYKRGVAFERLAEAARARESYDTVIKQFPDSTPANLAKQRLDAMNRPAR